MLKGDGAVIGATYGLLVRAKHFRKRSKDGKTESETDTDGVLGLPCAPPGSFHSLKSLMFMETRRSAEATQEWRGPRKKSHDLKDLPLLTHLHRSHQPYLNWLLKCGLFLFFNVFGFFTCVLSWQGCHFSEWFFKCGHSLSKWTVTKRGWKNQTPSHAHIHFYTFIHTCIHNINPEKMKGASAAEKSRVYTRALEGHEFNGFKQHIHARVHLAFHSIWHCDAHTYTSRPFLLDPTDSLQSALEPRGSSLPLEPI